MVGRRFFWYGSLMDSESELIERTRLRVAAWLVSECEAYGWTVRTSEGFLVRPGMEFRAEFAVFRDGSERVPWAVVELISADATASATLARFRRWREFGVEQTWMAQPKVGTLYQGVGDSVRFPEQFQLTGDGSAIAAAALFEA